MKDTNYAHYRTGAVALKQVQTDNDGERTRAQPAILAVLHQGRRVLLETEVHIRLSPGVQDPAKRVTIQRADVGEVTGATWEDAFRTLADRLRRAAESLEAAANGAHLSLPVASIPPDFAKGWPGAPVDASDEEEPSEEEPSE